MPARVIADALDGWREGERLLAELQPGTEEFEAVRLAVIELRTVYRELTAAEVSAESLERNRTIVVRARLVVRRDALRQ